MLTYFKKSIDRYLSDDAAITLALFVVASIITLMTLGSLLAPVLAGFIFAYLLQGIVSLLERCKLPHLLAVLVTFFVFCTVLLLIIFMILPLIWEQMTTFFNELPRMIQQFQTHLTNLPDKYPTFISDAQLQNLITAVNTQLGAAGQWLVSFSVSKIFSIVTMLIYLVLVPILIFFFLKDKKYITETIHSFLPENKRLINQVAAEMSVQIANYIRGKAIEIIIITVADYIVFALLGLHYALLLAVLVGLSVVVPYIGAVVVTIPVVLIAFIQWGWSNEFIMLVCIYGVIQAIDGNILVPLLFSEAVNLHPIAIIMAVLIFGGIWGLWGVFFAIPLATLIKAIYNAWPKDMEAETGGKD